LISLHIERKNDSFSKDFIDKVNEVN
jgi:hypothetical protein